jgi:hypothetical protein
VMRRQIGPDDSFRFNRRLKHPGDAVSLDETGATKSSGWRPAVIRFVSLYV